MTPSSRVPVELMLAAATLYSESSGRASGCSTGAGVGALIGAATGCGLEAAKSVRSCPREFPVALSKSAVPTTAEDTEVRAVSAGRPPGRSWSDVSLV